MEENKTTQQQADEAAEIIAKAAKMKKAIIWVGVCVVACIVGILIWFFIAENNQKKSTEAINAADAYYMEQQRTNPAEADSLALPMYIKVADMSGKSADRAAAMAGIILYNQGKYQEALEYLGKADLDDVVVAGGVSNLMADCYVNLDQNEQALQQYDKALSKVGDNQVIAPVILAKKANVYHAMGDYANEYKTLQQLNDQYPAYVDQNDLQKNIERAKIAAGTAE